MIHTIRAINAQMTDSQWITKEEAGIRLGSPERPLSGRRVHDLAKDGRLQSTQVRDPDTGHMAIRIHAGSLERFIFERDNAKSAIPTDIISDKIQTRGSRGTQDLMDQWIMRMVRAAQCAPSARLWLTISESAAYSGLPAAVIVDFIGQGKLEALNVGRRRRGGQWRIRRSDLEGFDGKGYPGANPDAFPELEGVSRRRGTD